VVSIAHHQELGKKLQKISQIKTQMLMRLVNVSQRCQMVVINATCYKTIPMTDVFGTFLPNIYLFLKTRFGNLKSHFQEFQELMNKYAKELCICNSNLMVFNFQQFRQISIKFSCFFSARPFANYFCAKHQL
jgi:hypothetical protein